ncbi:MAG: STAS domain-containing protein [Spirochaetes bacterium]|nr:STAS domain-containing protein [Spirochaetota bacterium]
MKITKKNIDGLALIKVEGSLITEHIKQLEHEIYSAFEKKNNIIIDFSELSFICSAGLSLLIASHKKAEGMKLKMVITGCSEDIIKLFKLTELDKHLDIKNSVEEARLYISSR